jgi:hypothetical protein
MRFRLNAAARLLASEAWWGAFSADQKKQYIEDHPGSKYAKDAVKEDPEQTKDVKQKPPTPGKSSPALKRTLQYVTENPVKLLLGGVFDKDTQKEYFKDLGYSDDEVTEFSDRLEGHTRDQTQEKADKDIEENLNASSRFGSFLRDRIGVEQEFIEAGIASADKWYDTKAKEAWDEFEHDREMGATMYDPEYDGTPEEYIERTKLRALKKNRDELKNPTFYRQGGANKAVLSTSRNPAGASTSWLSEDTGTSIEPDHEWTYSEMQDMGYVPIAGYSSLFGYVGEDEVTFVKKPTKVETNAAFRLAASRI